MINLTKRILIKSHGKAVFHESAASELYYLGYELVGTDSMTVEPEGSDGRTHRCRRRTRHCILP